MLDSLVFSRALPVTVTSSEHPRRTLARGSAATLALFLLAACTTTPKPALIIPDTLRKPCEPASVGKLETQGDLDALVIRQEGALQTCDKAKAAVIEIVDAHGKAAKPRRWWPF